MPFQWTIDGETLEAVLEMKYLGVIFTAHTGLFLTVGPLNTKMCAAWALLKRQYGRLQCLSSVGLLFSLYMVCVLNTASYGCEIWDLPSLPAAAVAARQQLSQSYPHMLKEILGVRQCPPTPVLLAEFGIKSLPDQWLLHAAGFWNSLTSPPIANVFRHVALDACLAAIS